MFKKFRLHAILIIACAVIIIFPMMREKPDAEKERKSLVAAEQFLTLVDAGQYDASWQHASGLLQEKITQEKWNEQLTKIHSIYGEPAGRSHQKSTFTTAAQDGPDGEYIILLYESDFQNKKSANETVIVTLEPDNIWRVAGYHIQ